MSDVLRKRAVFVCSPLRGDRARNATYLRDALRDSLARGEAPFAPHAIYPAVLDDDIAAERKQGIDSGLEWLSRADALVVYAGYGLSEGMLAELRVALARGLPVEIRLLSAKKENDNGAE